MATDGSGAPDEFEAGDIVGVVRVPGGDTPIEANIGRSVQRGPFIAEVAALGARRSAPQRDSPQAQSPAGRDVTAVAVTRIARLTRDDRDALAAFGARATWPSGFAVYERGTPADGIFIVLRGQIVLRNRLGAGRSFVPWIATVGESFGGEGLVQGGRYVSDARAEEESETLHLTTSRVSALMREQPAAALSLVRQIMAERSELLERFGEHATLTVEQRLIAALLRLAQSRTQGDGAAVSAVLPRRLLGELVGATRESISLVLGRLTADGLVQREGNGLIITDLEGLAQRFEHTGRGTVTSGIEVHDDRTLRHSVG
jgi:CRP-like cAMP-binding protein